MVYKSSDGGNTWEYKFSGGGSSGGDSYNKAQFINSTTGFLLANHGMTSQYFSNLYKSTDSGTSWQKLTDWTLPLCHSIYMIDENIGYAIGNDQPYLGSAKPYTIYKTTNGGKDWVKQISNATSLLNDIYFTDSKTGTIVGNNGTILRTLTGGTIE